MAEERRCIRNECDEGKSSYATREASQIYDPFCLITAQKRIQELRAQIRQRRQILEEGERRLQEANMAQSTEWPKELANLTKRWKRTHKLTTSARCVLVNEIITLFEFKPGVVAAEPEETAPDFETSAMPFVKRAQRRSHDDLYICGVTLPARPIDVSTYSKEELNTAIGLVIHMLNLIVRYLGIKLPFMIFHKGIYPYIRSSLQPRHSRYSHTMAHHGLLDIDFDLDLYQVLRMTALRYRSSGTDVNRELVQDGLLNDSYLKVRPNNSSYEGLLDSDEELEDDEDGDSNSENWNLVDVMPSFGRPNGESESIFQLGASIMPGVLGMMESLSGRHVANEYLNNGIHNARRKR
ncbi:hypothetical protein EC973_002614 [Apophysomyces ossiformis]|uniref:Autophagy-related protein 14 n=1 Tax=Apophysomyces ossiformis TaxID=679940 RepID=A0A8H7BMG7_9FUNG|nr:hypothetical protein EC973_002614 [Apophysomyces ossiformis]